MRQLSELVHEYCNTFLNNSLVVNMPPAFIRGFSEDGTSQTSFGSDMGKIVVPKSNPSIPATHLTPGPNMTVDVGRMLVRGTWNAQPYVRRLEIHY